MSDPVRFLNAFAQVFGVMTLYPDGHPSREPGSAVDKASLREVDMTEPGTLIADE